MATPFTIAHLSDLHLTSQDDQPRSEPQLFGKLRGMNQAFRNLAASAPVQACDQLILTGDITDRGEEDAWKGFWKTLEDNGLGDRCLVLPGNHDVCCLGTRIFKSEKQRYAEDLQKMRAGLRLGGDRFDLTFPKTYLFGGTREDNHDIAIIGLDSCNQGNRTAVTNAIGELGADQLEGLARALKKHSALPIKIVAMHHSPNIPQNDTAEKRDLSEMNEIERWGMEVPELERRSLRWICLAGNVRMIAHGHVHRKEDRSVNSVRIIGTPASTEPMPPGDLAGLKEVCPPAGPNANTYGFWRYTVTETRKTIGHDFVTVSF